MFDFHRNPFWVFFEVYDLVGIPNFAIQVADWQNKSAACLIKPREVEQQRINAGVDHAMTMVRFRGGNWRVVMTVEQFAKLIR